MNAGFIENYKISRNGNNFSVSIYSTTINTTKVFYAEYRLADGDAAEMRFNDRYGYTYYFTNINDLKTTIETKLN